MQLTRFHSTEKGGGDSYKISLPWLDLISVPVCDKKNSKCSQKRIISLFIVCPTNILGPITSRILTELLIVLPKVPQSLVLETQKG
jgi:hypothetical protein